MTAPIALFVYNRPDNTRKTLTALLANTLAPQTDLYVFSDGGRDQESWAAVREVRTLLHEVQEEVVNTRSLKSMTIVERQENFYLERNIIEGINQVFESHDTIIVLEDDIVTGPHFLEFMNEAFSLYRDEPQVMHVSGFTRLSLKDSPESTRPSSYFSPFMAGWGWGTWRDRWQQHFRHFTSRDEALEGLSPAMLSAIEYGGVFPCLKDLNRKPIPWDICWSIAIRRAGGLCLYPSRTLVRNIGLDGGTHYRHLPCQATRLIQYYDYDREPYDGHVALTTQRPASDPQIEEQMKEALTDWGIRYTWLGRSLRSLVRWCREARLSACLVLLTLLVTLHGTTLLAQQTWEAPSFPLHTGLPPTDQELLIYNVGRNMFLTKGTTWGTHAALTYNYGDALTYIVFNDGDHYQLYSPEAGGDHFLFVSETGVDIYTDHGISSNPIQSTYFRLEEQTDGSFRIVISDESNWAGTYPNYCIGWSPDNVDVDNNKNPLGTNVGLFLLSPNGQGYCLDWQYTYTEEVASYEARVALYDALLKADDLGVSTVDAGAVYVNASSTLQELQNTCAALLVLIAEAEGSTPAIDVTSLITNPSFGGNTDGWIVDMPNAYNKGYQGARYTNGDVTIDLFAEAWIDSNAGTLGTGSITQTLTGLNDGLYTLEVDAIACNQRTGETVTGVELIANSKSTYSTAVATGNERPEHFTLLCYCVGGIMTIGLQTTASATANWIAFDNVKLTYHGAGHSTATAVSVTPTTAQLIEGQTVQLTAQVEADSDLYAQAWWSSSDEAVATVDAFGLVTAKSFGTASITAHAVGSSLTATATIVIERSHTEELIINEIQVANIDQYIDPSTNYGGWIELYNPTASAISLGNLIVSDHLGNRCQLPEDMGVVEPQQYRNLWFDHYDTGTAQSSEAYKQVNFKLQWEGGTIIINDKEGNVAVQQQYPAGIQRCSYARTTDGTGQWQWTGTPSPEATNAGSSFAQTQLEMPAVDRDATVFTADFDVHVAIPDGAVLRYTTDGSTPTLDNGATSADGTFHIGGATSVLRFRLFKDGYLPSSVVTRTYIYKDRDYYLPIISVVTDPDNLYDDTIGAYVDGSNGTSGNNKSFSNKNRAWERPVNFEYLVPDEDDSGSFLMALSQECDFEVCGGWSRHFSPAGSFRLKGGKYYLGQNFFPYPFFKDKPYIKNKALQVRNGGNENVARHKDAAIHEMILKSGFNVDCQAAQPAHIFINGQYMFMFNIREPNNKNHGYSNYGIDTDEMDQFEINGSKGYEQKTGDDTVFRRWMTLAQQLADDPANDAIYAEICDIVDIDEYCNYMAAECYIGSSDWLTNSNNAKGYRSQHDGKFHLVMMDLDAAFSTTGMVSSLSGRLYDSRYDTGKNFLIDIFLNMLRYEPFKRRFIDAFCIVNGSVFDPERCTEIANALKDEMYNAIAFEGHASDLESRTASTITHVTDNGQRSSRISNMSSYFGLNAEDTYSLTVQSNIDGGTLWLNKEEIPKNKFSGTLFAPATLKATTPAGYRFAGWRLEGAAMSLLSSETLFDTASRWQYYDQGSLDGTAWQDTGDDIEWREGQAPLGYGNVGINGSSDIATTLDYGTNSSDKRPTYYFRKTFTLDEQPNNNESYELTWYVDDGFVAYVNGTEVGRYLMSGTPTYASFSTSYVSATAATATVVIPNDLLHEGENVIAVEVHNTSKTSSDIYWTAMLQHKVYSQTYVSTDAALDITTLGTNSATLTATYERLPDEELLADIATPIKVNEVSAGNAIFIGDYYKKNDWIELYNTTDSELDVAGLFVSDDLDDPLKYQIPTASTLNTRIPAHGHLILWADKLEPITQLHTDFKLGNINSQRALISSSTAFAEANAEFFNAHPALKDFADALTYDLHNGDQSVGRYPDGANSFYLMNRPTIEKTNALHSYDTLIGEDEGIMELTNATFTLDLAEGWNWISHPLSNAIAVGDFGTYADRILSQTLEAYYSSESRQMKGLLKHLTSGSLYKVEMSEAHTYTFTGQQPATAAPVNLHPGWNWIGYPLTGAQTLDAAFATAKIDEGDVIIGQSGFAEYSADEGWVGTLSSLMPGKGYLYRASTTKALRLAPAASRVRLRQPKPKHNSSPTAASDDSVIGVTAPDRHAYPNVMAIIGRLEGDTLAADGLLTIAAYADGECRGISQRIDGKLYLTVYGQGGETLSFKAYDEAGNTFGIEQTMAFSADILGSRTRPYMFTLATAMPTEIAAPASEERLAQLTGIYNINGQFVGTDSRLLRRGVYILRSAGGQYHKMFVK